MAGLMRGRGDQKGGWRVTDQTHGAKSSQKWHEVPRSMRLLALTQPTHPLKEGCAVVSLNSKWHEVPRSSDLLMEVMVQKAASTAPISARCPVANSEAHLLGDIVECSLIQCRRASHRM